MKFPLVIRNYKNWPNYKDVRDDNGDFVCLVSSTEMASLIVRALTTQQQVENGMEKMGFERKAGEAKA